MDALVVAQPVSIRLRRVTVLIIFSVRVQLFQLTDKSSSIQSGLPRNHLLRRSWLRSCQARQLASWWLKRHSPGIILPWTSVAVQPRLPWLMRWISSRAASWRPS